MARIDFNPRPLAGATSRVCGNGADRVISIHAPLRGRRDYFCKICQMVIFQSTPPCGGDDAAGSSQCNRPDFNPRPLAGATTSAVHVQTSDLFQSTPPCGGDYAAGSTAPACRDFNPRPLAGATIALLKPCSVVTLFQSTPPCGGDIKIPRSLRQWPHFNPRPLAGATFPDVWSLG